MVSSDLPQELLIDIFSRIPAKSVGQCRCLSKPWRHILSSPAFIKSHLNRKTHPQSLLLIAESHSPIATTIKDGAVSRELELPFDYPDILGSCHGLVLFVRKDNDDMFLVNPVTLDKVIIPKSPLALKDGERKVVTMHGFGYDSSVDDYKIVTLSYYKVDVGDEDEDEIEDEQELETFVDVYYVKRGVWKRVESCSLYNHGFHESHSGTFFDGAIHWLATGRESVYQSVLVAFGLFDEVFTLIPTPRDMKMESCFFFQPVVLGGCLCIIDVRHDRQANVWMMKEYGWVESWTKVSIDTCGKWGIERPLCFIWDQEILSAAEGRLLGVYDVKERTLLRDIIVDGVLAVLEDGVTFVPSLVSPANVDRASLPDVAYKEASANLAQALKNNLVLVLDMDYRTKVSALEQEDKESELRKTRDELSELTREHKKMQAVIRRLSEEFVEAVMSSVTRGMVKQAYKVPSKFQLDFYEDVVRYCRCLLRESGEVGEDVVMLVGPDVRDSC